METAYSIGKKKRIAGKKFRAAREIAERKMVGDPF